MAPSGIVLSFVALLAVLDFGLALQCYQCNTEQDRACADSTKISKYLTDCSSPDSKTYNQRFFSQVLPNDLLKYVDGAPRLCHKFVMKNGAVIRTCLDGNPANPNQTCKVLEAASATALEINKQVKECSVCDKEGCNGAGSMYLSLPLASLALIVSYLYYKQ